MLMDSPQVAAAQAESRPPEAPHASNVAVARRLCRCRLLAWAGLALGVLPGLIFIAALVVIRRNTEHDPLEGPDPAEVDLLRYLGPVAVAGVVAFIASCCGLVCTYRARQRLQEADAMKALCRAQSRPDGG
jgi:hypothetical protein